MLRQQENVCVIMSAPGWRRGPGLRGQGGVLKGQGACCYIWLEARGSNMAFYNVAFQVFQVWALELEGQAL